MLPRRVIILIVCTLMLFLGVYTWNQRTGGWDRLCAGIGLEFTGGIVRGFQGVKDSFRDIAVNYREVRETRVRNRELQQQVFALQKKLDDAGEDLAELARLRKLMRLTYPPSWPAIASRVLAWRTGPNSALNTLMLSNGYLTGAPVGTPVVSWQGVVGRILKASPTSSVVLLLTDAGSRVSVITSEGRVQGILAGSGAGVPLELRFVRQNSVVKVGELLLTSGLDSLFPKGVPVARVTAISTGAASRTGASVLDIQAEPLVDFHFLEEVFLLQRPGDAISPEKDDVYTRRLPLPEAEAESLPESQLPPGGNR